MKKIAIALIAVVAFAGAACAADVMELPAKNGKVTFNHKKHADASRTARLAMQPRKAAKSKGSARTLPTRPVKAATKRRRPVRQNVASATRSNKDFVSDVLQKKG